MIKSPQVILIGTNLVSGYFFKIIMIIITIKIITIITKIKIYNKKKRKKKKKNIFSKLPFSTINFR